MEPTSRLNPHGTPLFKIIALLAFAFLIAILSSLGTYYFMNKQYQKQLEFFKQIKQKDFIEITKNTEELKYTDIEIPTEWQLYVNDQYGFSFRFSKNFKVSAKSQVEDMLNPFFGVTISDQRGQNGYFINIYDKTLNDQVSITKRYLTQDNISVKILSEQKIKKNNYYGVKLTYENGNTSDDSYYKAAIIFFEVKGKIYVFDEVYEIEKMNPINEIESKAIFNSLTLN